MSMEKNFSSRYNSRVSTYRGGRAEYLRGETYTAERGDQLGELCSLVFGDAFKVKDLFRESCTNRRLPKFDFLELLGRGLVGRGRGGLAGGAGSGLGAAAMHDGPRGTRACRGGDGTTDAVVDLLTLGGRRLAVGLIPHHVGMGPSLELGIEGRRGAER